MRAPGGGNQPASMLPPRQRGAQGVLLVELKVSAFADGVGERAVIRAVIRAVRLINNHWGASKVK